MGQPELPVCYLVWISELAEDYLLGPEGPYISTISIKVFVKSVLVVLFFIFIHVVAEIQILFPLGSGHFPDDSVISDKLFFSYTCQGEKNFSVFLKVLKSLFRQCSQRALRLVRADILQYSLCPGSGEASSSSSAVPWLWLL